MNKENLLIIGAGQYGQVVKEIAELLDCFHEISFLDDNAKEAIGKISEMEHYTTVYHKAIVAIGNAEVRKRTTEQLIACGYEITTLLHPMAIVSPSAVIADGCVVEAGAIINTSAELDRGVLVSPGAVINHNSEIRAFVHVDCNAVVEAGCIVPNDIKIVSGSVFSKNKM